MKKEKKPKSRTLRKRNSLRAAKYSLKAGAYVAPLVPVAVETGIHWQDWFSTSAGFHVGSGFVMLMLSALLTYLAIAKKKRLLEKFSAFWGVAIIIASWAVSLLLLSSILHQIGMMLVYIALSVMASATMDEVETRAVEKELAFYEKLVSENGLDPRQVAKEAKREEKRRLAEEEAKAAAESEKVRFIPHD